MDVTYAFSALLECTRCSGVVTCCGLGGYEPEMVPDEDGGYSQEYYKIFAPRYFSTPLPIFRPPRCPDPVRAQLPLSFALFFCDPGGAANHVRQCVEEVLNQAGISSRRSNGGFIPLDDRIRTFAAQDAENADRADALRWIGNFGSHPGGLSKDDLLDAYEILDVLLEDLYIGHRRSVQQMVDQINAARGPRR